jgi:hypothetical protein
MRLKPISNVPRQQQNDQDQKAPWISSGCTPFSTKGMPDDELISGYARLNRQAYSFGAMMKRFLGMSPWKRTRLGCQVYAGANLSTRKRYFKGLRNPQPFAGAFSSI